MTITNKENFKKTDILKRYVLVFFVIYFNTSSLAVSTRMSYEKYIIISLLFSITIFACKFIKNKNFIINQAAMLTMILSAISIITTMVINQDFGILNLVIIAQLFIAFLFSHFISFDDFIRTYIKIMVFLSVFSLLIMYVITPFFKGLTSLFPLRYNSSGLALRDYIFGFHFENHIVASKRNTGIFREMGVYQHFLNLALLFYLFYLKENKLSIIMMLSISILSTFSTPGIIFLFLIIGIYLYQGVGNKKIKIFKMTLVFILIMVLMNIIIPNFFTSIEKSIYKLFGYSGSYFGRIGAIKGNILAWLESPILGNGIEKGLHLAEELYLGQFNKHNTSTTTSFMAIYGLFYTITMSIPLVLIVSKFKIKRISKILLITGLFMSLNTQRYIYDQFYYVMVFSYFMKEDNEGECL